MIGVPQPIAPIDTLRRYALAAVCTLLCLTFLDNTIVSVALGDIQQQTHAGVQALQWVVNAYALVFASMMLLAGALGDRFGHRIVMFVGASVFIAGSVVCALATTSGFLITGRAVMGLGAAASEPATLAMLRHLFPGRRERARATGVWAAVCGLALALGPVIGGVIIGIADWHWIFWFNLAFGAAALAVGALVLPETEKSSRPIDSLGAGLGAGALALLIFAVIEGESAGFGSAPVLTLFCCGGVAGVAFAWRQRVAAAPLLDRIATRSPVFAAANIVSFATYFGTFAVFFFSALYLHVVAGQGGLRIAAEFAPMAGAMILASLATGRWLARTGARRPVVAGCVMFAAGLLLTAQALSPHPDFVPLAGALLLVGIGIGLAVVPTTFSAVDAVPASRAGMASSAVNTSREIGAVVGTAVLGAIVNASLIAHLDAKLDSLGIPTLKQILIPLVLHGGAGLEGSAAATQSLGGVGEQLLPAVYDAFHAALRECLVASAIIVALAGLIAGVMLTPANRQAPAARAAADAQPAASKSGR